MGDADDGISDEFIDDDDDLTTAFRKVFLASKSVAIDLDRKSSPIQGY